MKRLLVLIAFAVTIFLLGVCVRTATGLAVSFVADWRFAHALRVTVEQQQREAAKATADLKQQLDARHKE